MDYLKYLNAFIDEANDNVHSLNRRLLELEQSPGGRASLDGLYRAAHSLKASSQTMCFNKMARLMHETEFLISGVRDGRIKPDGRLFDLLFRCVDCYESFLFHLCEYGSEGGDGYEEILGEIIGLYGESGEFISYCGERPSAATLAADGANGPNVLNAPNGTFFGKPVYSPGESEALLAEARGGKRIYEIGITLIKDCLMKAARAYIIFSALEKRCKILKTSPDAEDIESERFGDSFSATVATEASFDRLRDIIAGLSEIEFFDIYELQYDEISAGAEAYTIGKGRTVRIDIYQLDALQAFVSELSLRASNLAGLLPRPYTADIASAVGKLESAAANVGGAASKLRTTPMTDTFARLIILCGEASKEMGKEADLVVNGSETRCDVGLISPLTQILTHIVRNSVDHGIEPPAARAAAGKPARGRIGVSARSDETGLVVEAEDDGAGIDLRKVADKAVENGALSREQIRAMPRDELINLVFAPSFSTREQVSMYSGRGVGLDVVKTKTEEYGGFVEIESKDGLGVKITLRFPNRATGADKTNKRRGTEFVRTLRFAAEPPARVKTVAGL